MGALLALVSSVAWGSADVAGGLGARRVGSVRVIAVNYPAGAIILTLFALFVVGAVLALVAVVLVSRESGPHARITPRALLLSAGAGIAIGLFLTALGIAPEGSGVWAATLSRWWSTLGMIVVTVILLSRSGLAKWRPYPWLFAIGAGALDALANGFFQLAAQDGELAVVAVIGSLYPATTLLIAHFLLKERMSVVQWSGVALALGAVVALTV